MPARSVARLMALFVFSLGASSGVAFAQKTSIEDGASSPQSPAEIATRFGLAGTWSDDCNRPPAQDHIYLVFTVRNGKLFIDRDYGNHKDIANNQVVAAKAGPNGTLEVTTYYGSLNPPQTRRNVLEFANGRQRPLVSQNVDTGEYSIKDGKLSNGAPAPWITRCR
ncbi:MAG TPA: hypothetical protein VMI56_04885 [Reyranella sp.]|nr:hypothetical protein [Reyranella sp.]